MYHAAQHPPVSVRLAGPDTSTPARRVGSVRRTTHLDVTPIDKPAARSVAAIEGTARDILTEADGSVRLLAEDRLVVRSGDDGAIAEATVTPPLPDITVLVGVRIGAGFRAAIAPALVAAA